MRDIVYIISHIDKALEFEWVAQYLDRERFRLTFVLLNPNPNSQLEQFARRQGWQAFYIPYRSKRDLPAAIFRLWRLLGLLRPQTVHCHLVDANLVGLVAAWLRGIPQRIYTRHHSTFHHDYQPHAVWYDRLSNLLSTDVVAITDMVRQVLLERELVNPDKVTLIHHSLDLGAFRKSDLPERVELLRQKYGLPSKGQGPVVGVISRYTEWKGVQHIIPAFERLLGKYPDARLLLANARKGEYVAQLDALLSRLPEGSYIEVPFESDMVALYGLFDLFVHAPINAHCEAFGQIYIEAMMAGVPSVFTLSGIAHEVVVDGHNALVAPYADSGGIYDRMLQLLLQPDLAARLVEKGRETAQAHFSIKRKIQGLEHLYSRLSGPSLRLLGGRLVRA